MPLEPSELSNTQNKKKNDEYLENETNEMSFNKKMNKRDFLKCCKLKTGFFGDYEIYDYRKICIPIINCLVSEDKINLCFYCIFCKRIHYHGAGKEFGEGDGHRSSHCTNEKSFYKFMGYILREVKMG